MNYPALYRQFLHHQTAASLADLFRATGSWERMQIASLDLPGDERLPFILATITSPCSSSGEFAAAMAAIFLEKSRLGSLGSELCSGLFYLPVIARPSSLPPRIRSLFSVELALAHELMHLEDMLQWIDEEPDYPDQAACHCLNACTRKNLDASIELEIRKIFRLEPRAIGNDFDNGEKLIIESLLFGLMMQYACKTREEFIEHKVAAYVEAVREAFLEKFPDAGEAIDGHVRQSLLRHGTALFGPDPDNRIALLQKEIVDKLLDDTIAAIDGAD